MPSKPPLDYILDRDTGVRVRASAANYARDPASGLRARQHSIRKIGNTVVVETL